MMLRAAFPFLATGWAVLWAAASMMDGGFKFGPNEAGILFMIPATAWLFGWLRANALAPISSGSGWDMARAILGLAPLLLIAGTPLITEHMRHMAPGAAHKDTVTEALKTACFLLPWLLVLAIRAQTGDAEAAAPAAQPISLPKPRAPSPGVMVAVGDVQRPLPWNQILWLEADNNYVRVHTGDRDYFVRRSLRELLTEAGDRFARIHKSRAVNLAEVAALKPLTNGDGEVHLRAGKKLRMSRRYRQDLAALLKP